MTPEQQSTKPLLAELQNYRDQFVSITYEARALSDGLTENQWHWTPAPNEWSVAQCIDHLNVVNGLLLPRFAEAIREGATRGRRSVGPFRYNAVERWFIRALAPEAQVKIQAPRIYVPAARPATPDVLPRFLELQDELMRCIETANGLDLKRIKVASPVSFLVRLSLGAWFAATIAHEWNHLRQAQRVCNSPDFP